MKPGDLRFVHEWETVFEGKMDGDWSARRVDTIEHGEVFMVVSVIPMMGSNEAWDIFIMYERGFGWLAIHRSESEKLE